MVEINSGMAPTESALDAVAETVGEGTGEAFKVLGSEMRLVILLALWEDYVPFSGENIATFSNLYDRVELHDTGQFTYYLEKARERHSTQSETDQNMDESIQARDQVTDFVT